MANIAVPCGRSDVLAKIENDKTRQADEKLQAKIDDVRRDEQAREIVRRERSAAQLRLPPVRDDYTLRSYLNEPKLPKVERIQGLQRVGQDAAQIAAYKTGKTTLTANLAKALADGSAFLGEFGVQCPIGRVGFWNAEMDPEDFEGYLREAQIENADGVAIWNLRGYRVDPLTDAGREAAVDWLKDNDVSYWIVDPWARICSWSRVNENDNGEVSTLLQRIREIADDAGVAELLLVHHAGYVPGRARGASVFSDNADVLWQYDRDEDDVRYLHAFGRGIDDVRGVVELENGVTQFKAVSRRAARMSTAIREAVEFVRANPGCKRQDAYSEMSIGAASKKSVIDEAIRLGFLQEQRPDGRTCALYAVEREGFDV
jgi:hypothetical protein